MPNLLVPEIALTVQASRGIKVYICNIATQPGETTGYDVCDHVRAIEQHTKRGMFQYVIANDVFDATPPPGGASDWVRLPAEPLNGCHLITGDLRDPEHPWRHAPGRMGAMLVELLARPNGLRHKGSQ
jgi:hypothetical protein